MNRMPLQELENTYSYLSGRHLRSYANICETPSGLKVHTGSHQLIQTDKQTSKQTNTLIE